MYAASARFFETLTKGGDWLAQVQVLLDGDPIAVLDGNSSPALVGGSVNVSRQTIRRDGTVELWSTDPADGPSSVASLLVPLRGEMRLWVGVRYWDATPAETAAGTDTEYVPVGTLVVTGRDVGAWPHYTVTGFDRMFLLPKLTDPYVIAAGTNVRTALVKLLTTLVPGSRLLYTIPTTEHTTGAQAFEEDTESADIAQQLAAAAGWMFYVDPTGTFVATPEPSTDDPPDLSYLPGADALLMRPTEQVDAKDAVNTVVATATGQDDSTVRFRSVVTDNDVNSITYWAAVGKRPVRHSSPLYRTQAQTDLAAQTVFRRTVGLADTVAVPAAPNPCLEAGDVLYVEDPDQGLALRLLIDSFSVSLTPEQQELTCRSRVVR